MATESQGANGLVALIGLVVGVIATMLLTRAPLDSGRPPESTVPAERRAALQDIDARLWEDPFGVLARHNGEHEGQVAPGSAKMQHPDSLDTRHLCAAIGSLRPLPGKLLLMPVLVSNAPYPDAGEQRMRTRYAVQAALSVEHFIPLDYEHIGQLVHPIGRSAQAKGRRGSGEIELAPVSIPFEVFRRKAGRQHHPMPTEPAATSAGSAARTQANGPASEENEGFYVLVLWLDEEAFSSPTAALGPIKAIRGVLETIVEGCVHTVAHEAPASRKTAKGKPLAADARASGASLKIEFALLGPARSDTLRAMIVELSCDDAKKCSRPSSKEGPRLAIYSPFATASGVDLLTLDDVARKACDREAQHWLDPDWRSRLAVTPRRSGSLLHDFFRACDIDFFSTISTDQELGVALAKELKRRDPQDAGLTSDTYHVALISEWDTYYGRMLPQAVMRGAGGDLEDSCEDDPLEIDRSRFADREHAKPCRALRFTYMQGLDGGVARRVADGEASADTSDARAPTEKAQGTQQFDYLRRLSARIQRADSALRNLKGGWALSHIGRYADHQIRAIGVLGVDVYDKISILRALTGDFPIAVFFTTDLDARLLDEKDLPWTRNLIVVSSFGFELAECVQAGIPPFRGVYQTSAYLSGRLALYNAFSKEETGRGAHCPEGRNEHALFAPRVPSAKAGGTYLLGQETIDVWMARPRVFELGLRGARDLSRDASDGVLSSVGDLYPSVPSFMPDGRAVLLFVALIAFAGFMVFLMPAARRAAAEVGHFLLPICTNRGAAWGRIVVVLGLLLIVLLLEGLVLCAYLEADTNRGEPFAWFEGISAWPSELIRNVALVLTYVFFLAACGRLDRSNAEILSWLPAANGNETLTAWDRFVGKLPSPGRSMHQMYDFLRAYSTLSAPRWCGLRAAIWTAVFWVIALVFMEELGYPALPVRGEYAALLDQLLVLVAVPSFLLLLFFTVDASRLCDRFSRALSSRDEPVAWSIAQLDLPFDAPNQRVDLEPLRVSIRDAVAMTRIVAKRTRAIVSMVYFPFVVMALLVLARWSRFDHWGVSPGLLVILIATFVIACLAAWFMQRTATKVRARALAILSSALLVRRGIASDAEPSEAQIEQLIESTASLREGAFAPILQQPAVVAALFPFASSLLPQIERLLKAIP